MPKYHFSRHGGPVHHPSAHPNKQIRRRLERISQKHKGSMVRLASQRDAFSAPTPRQNRCFAAALVENWCHHLLHNNALYARSDLYPKIPLPSVQLQKLQLQLPLWKDVKVSNSSPSLYTKQNYWPSTELSENSAQIQLHRYDGRSLAWTKKTLLNQGAQLRLLTKQKVNFLRLIPTTESADDSFWLSQMIYTICRLAKTKISLDLTIPSTTAPIQRLEVLTQAWQNLQTWSEQGETIRLIVSSSDLADLWPIISEQNSLNLDKRSRIFVLVSKIDRHIPELLNQHKQIAVHLGLDSERLTWLWLQPETNLVILSCPQGHFHIPIYYRLLQEDNNFYLCNPLAANYPVLYNKFSGKIILKEACSCGFSAPSIEL